MTDSIVTEHLVLRRPVPEDWSAWHAFHITPRSTFVGGGRGPVQASFRGFASVLGHWQFRGWGLWILTPSGEEAAVGAVGPWYPVGWPEREIGWMIWDESLEGTGLAREAAAGGASGCLQAPRLEHRRQLRRPGERAIPAPGGTARCPDRRGSGTSGRGAATRLSPSGAGGGCMTIADADGA